jgi:hypothetical protein
MPTETQDVRDTAAFATHEPRSSFAATLREVAQLNDRAKVTPGTDVREIATLGDAVFPTAYSTLREVADLDSASYPSVRYVADTRDLARVLSFISAEVVSTEDVREVALIHGRVVAPPTAGLHEVARLGDAIHWQGGPASLHEVARLRSHAWPSNPATLRELAKLDDALVAHLRSVVDVRETARLSDNVVALFRSEALLHEVALLDDAAFPRLTQRPVLHETFYADDRAVPPPAGRAYTCSILNWGMSEYQNYSFLTQAGNYGAGQNLWRLDASADYGKPIESWITTGRLDIGSSHGKRPAALYAAGRSAEPLILTVLGDVEGVLMSFDYKLELRDQTNYRNNKAILGKGFRSRYLQFKLQAVKYLGFRLLTAEVDLAESQRRVG